MDVPEMASSEQIILSYHGRSADERRGRRRILPKLNARWSEERKRRLSGLHAIWACYDRGHILKSQGYRHGDREGAEMRGKYGKQLINR